MDSLILGMQNKRVQGYENAVEINEVVEQFKPQYLSFFQGGEIQENVTQNYWYSLYLSRKRLQKRNIRVEIECDKNGSQKKQSSGLVADSILQTITYDGKEFVLNSDGKNLATIVHEPLKLKKSFYSENKRLLTDKDEVIGEYAVIKAQQTKDKYVCPKCGAENSLSQLLDGCDYCGTKFRLEDFNKKISAFGFRSDISKGAKNFMNTMGKLFPIAVILIIAIASLFIMFPIVPDTVIASSVSFIAPLIVALMIAGLFSVIVLNIVQKMIQRYDTKGNGELLSEIRRDNVSFSEEQFFAGLEYKIKSIHFSETSDEINVYSKNDLSAFLPNYQNVIDCETEKIKMTGYHINQGSSEQEIEVSMILKLWFFNGNKVLKRREHLLVTAKTDINNCTQLKNEATVYTCENCGNTISILNGGVCESCSTRLNLEKFDWVVGAYSVTKLTKHKETNWITIIVAIIAAVIALGICMPYFLNTFLIAIN